MKVKDLIKKLQSIKDQDTIVVVTSSNFEQGVAKVEANDIYEFSGEIVSESFRDAFDGGLYSSNIIRHNINGKHKFVTIT